MSTPVRLQTHVWNPLGKRRALLLHGLSSDGGTWWRVASDLAEDGWMVIAPDLRSHGRSPSSTDHRLTTMTADVALLGAGWDLVVGHSLGGSIAAVLASQQDVPLMMLIDPVLELPAPHREPLRESNKAALVHRSAADIRAANPTWSERDVQRQALAMAAMTPDVIDEVFDDNDPWDVRWATPAWSGRVHLLAADQGLGGLLTPRVMAEVIHAVGDRVTGSVAHGAGHAIHREHPQLVMELVFSLTGAG